MSRESDVIEFLLDTCEGVLHSRDILWRIAVNVEDWQKYYDQGLGEATSLADVKRQMEPMREAAALVLAGADVGVLRAMRLTTPTHLM